MSVRAKVRQIILLASTMVTMVPAAATVTTHNNPGDKSESVFFYVRASVKPAVAEPRGST
jgi:hypothetical protein